MELIMEVKHNSDIYWEQLEHQTASRIVAKLVNQYDNTAICEIAIRLAKELVKQLKEQNEPHTKYYTRN